MANEAYILKHYKKIAKNFGLNGTSTIQDPYIRQAELHFFIQELKGLALSSQFSLLDLGCGNGYLLDYLHREFPAALLTGLEFTPELAALATSRQLENTTIVQGSAKELESFAPNSFDIIITERVIINLLSWKQQALALQNIATWLKPQGYYLLSESFKEPWQELNQARHEMNIPPVPISKHNRYLTQKLAVYLARLNLVKQTTFMPANYLSTHFYITRVLHPFIKPQGGRKKESHFAHFFDQALPSAIGNYSPILFYRYQKIA